MVRFAAATLTPVVLLAVGCLSGGPWPFLAALYMTALMALLDHLVAAAPKAEGEEFPAAPALSVLLAVLHFPLLALGVAALAGTNGLPVADRAALFLGLGLFFGQVSNSNAHELIHKTNRGLHRLGMWVYISMLYGHHTSAHVRVHHIHVGSDADPASARAGEGFYRYALRAWVHGFRAGLAAERALMARSKRARLNPYVIYLSGAALTLACAWALAGGAGVLALVLLALYAQSQLLMSDYVQHYGLRRKRRESGKLEPVGPQHCWNAPHVASSALMLNATRHSDHHVNPARAYPDLRLNPGMPELPYSLPIMAALALWPRQWRRVMDKRLRAWS